MRLPLLRSSGGGGSEALVKHARYNPLSLLQHREMSEESKQKVPSTSRVTLPVELKRARMKAGMSHSELHRVTRLSRTVLIGYEAGRTMPGGPELELLCNALRVTPNKLLYGTEEPFRANEALARLGLDSEAVGFGHLMVVFQMLSAEERHALLSLMHSIIEARHGREKFTEMVAVMKELDQFIPVIFERIGFSPDRAFTPEVAAQLEAEAKRRFGRFEQKPAQKSSRKKR
jgi:transcriptional regulator with XRE-family HTH domain